MPLAPKQAFDAIKVLWPDTVRIVRGDEWTVHICNSVVRTRSLVVAIDWTCTDGTYEPPKWIIPDDLKTILQKGHCMTKHTIEIEVDIPDDLEFDRIGCAREGEPWISFDSSARGHGVTSFNVIILREKWKPPAFLKKGWIAMSVSGKWFWCKNRFTMSDYTGLNAAGVMIDLSLFNFTPPKCTDWTQSLREIPGVEE